MAFFPQWIAHLGVLSLFDSSRLLFSWCRVRACIYFGREHRLGHWRSNWWVTAVWTETHPLGVWASSLFRITALNLTNVHEPCLTVENTPELFPWVCIVGLIGCVSMSHHYRTHSRMASADIQVQWIQTQGLVTAYVLKRVTLAFFWPSVTAVPKRTSCGLPEVGADSPTSDAGKVRSQLFHKCLSFSSTTKKWGWRKLKLFPCLHSFCHLTLKKHCQKGNFSPPQVPVIPLAGVAFGEVVCVNRHPYLLMLDK